ncbi:MAG: zinc metallopeptidase [Anaerovoracaceae bacterium]
MYFNFFDPTIILLLIGVVITLVAQAKVKSAYSKYSAVPNRNGITGYEAARKILDNNGLKDVKIENIGGTMSDHYDPKGRVMRLSAGVRDRATIASISIAAHESGHAIQHAKGYNPLKVRNAIAKPIGLVSNLSFPLILIGILISSVGYATQGKMLFDFGILFFAGVLIFQLVTLPVEFNASKRALQELDVSGIITSVEEVGAKKMLSAAAMTYVAALLVSILNLARLLLIRNR